MHRTAARPLSRPFPATFTKHTLAAAVLFTLALSGCHRTTTLDESKASTRVDAPRAKPQAADAELANIDILSEAAPVADAAAAAARDDVDKVVVTGSRLSQPQQEAAKRAVGTISGGHAFAPVAPPPPPAPIMIAPYEAMPMEAFANTEKYETHDDNPVRRASEEPISTFSIDVDTGSYANVRSLLRNGQRPPADAVRAEEMINYFDYGHAAPTSLNAPFRVTTELAPAPWNGKRQLLMVGIKGYDVPKAGLPPANLVFLIDTSGSMSPEDRLPLVKKSLAQLVEHLRPQDRVSMVVYAGSAGLVLPPTPGDQREKILAALDNLGAGGSTNGGAGIELAYAMAKQAYVKNGVNRVILATDGDFNVGVTDRKTLETLVGDQRKHGIALTTLGFGRGNYNDAMAERLADVGDGNHAYIDTLQEARKVLVQEMQSTLLTIARDVKIQIEFDPANVAEYRLIGYENRMLRREDFANDKVDAGDIGAGHEVTALYEITLVGSGADRLPALRYGDDRPKASNRVATGELAHLRLRYKCPGQDASRLIERAVLKTELRATPSPALRFAATVAAYADGLRGGKHLERWSWDDIARSARQTAGSDPWGQRAEFIGLVDDARRITAGDAPQIGMIAE